jgi:hypothetical protein
VTATLSCLPADEQRMRRIGFGAVARTQQLIDRTLAEVAGVGRSVQSRHAGQNYGRHCLSPVHFTEGRRAGTSVAAAGTILTAELALAHGLACNTAGGA